MSSRDAGPEPLSDTTPAPAVSAPAADAARRWVSLSLLLVLLVVALSGGATAGLTYWSYAAVYLRKPADLPRCVRRARVDLRKPVLSSGTEPRETDTGATVYLTRYQDRAVSCASLVSEKLSRRFAGVLAEHDPEHQAQGLLQLVRDSAQQGPAFDREVSAAYRLASAVFRALPQDVPAVQAASDEVATIFACRFVDPRRSCPTRPPMPRVVWLAGVPAAASLLGLLWIGGSAGSSRSRAWWRRRKAEKKTAAEKEPAKEALDEEAQAGGEGEGGEKGQ